MKTMNKVATLIATAALASAAGAQSIDNWRNGSGDVYWKNGSNELCWRDNFWTPATAAKGCDGAIVAAPAPAPAPAPEPTAAPVVPLSGEFPFSLIFFSSLTGPTTGDITYVNRLGTY